MILIHGWMQHWNWYVPGSRPAVSKAALLPADTNRDFAPGPAETSDPSAASLAHSGANVVFPDRPFRVR